MRSAGSVLAGIVAWGIVWVGLNALMGAAMPGSFNDDGTTDSVGLLIVLILLSVGVSILAGYLTARLAARREIAHALALGVVQLAIGIAVQAGFWDLLPIWYHLSFLALLLPGNVLGGVIRRSANAGVAAPA